MKSVFYDIMNKIKIEEQKIPIKEEKEIDIVSYGNEDVNKLTDEILADEYKFFELINKEKYSISDVNDYSNFTNRNKQKIIKSNSVNVDKILSEIYGEDNIPILGKKRFKKLEVVDKN